MKHLLKESAILLCVVVILVFVLVACGGGSVAPPSAPAVTAAQYSATFQPTPIALDRSDYPTNEFVWLVYQPLTAVAENVAISTDKTWYTFTLRSGVTFQDGTPLTAEDVVSSWTLLAKAQIWPSVSFVEAIDESTVRVILNSPANDFLAKEIQDLPIVKVSHVSSSQVKLVGTGPYIVSKVTRTGDTLGIILKYRGTPPAGLPAQLEFCPNCGGGTIGGRRPPPPPPPSILELLISMGALSQ